MEPQLGDVSDDGYWVLTESGWQATEQQNQALAIGATPYNQTEESVPSLVTIDSSSNNLHSHNVLEDQNQIYSFVVIGMICFGLLMQIIGMHLDSWVVEDDNEDDVEVWFKDANAGFGLTEVTMDCSEVTGTDSETGENNKDMCKFAAGMLIGEISAFDILNAETVSELTDDLPDEISGPISEMCDTLEDFSEDTTEDKEGIENCQSADSAGSTAIVLFWISFVAGIVALVAGVLGIFTVAPHTGEIKKYSISISAFVSIIAFVCWIVMIPLEDDDVFGAGFYITIFSILILVSSAVFTFINSSKPTKTIVF